MNYVNTIEFPGLGNGLEIAVNPVAFKLFGFNIYWYGIIISICYLIVVLNSIRKSKEFGIKQDDIIDLVMYAIPISIIFSRLFYVAVNWGEFKDDPIKIINLRTGGTAIFGGIIAVLIFIYIFSRIKKINPVKILDLIALSTPLSMAIGRWGNFINQELYGINTKLPWGMTSPKIRQELEMNYNFLKERAIDINPALPVHPTFFYEFIWNLMVFALVSFWYKKIKKANGEIICVGFVGYGLGRFLIDSLRMDLLILNNVKINSLIGIIIFISALIILIMIRKNKSKSEISDEARKIETKYGKLLKEIQEEEPEKIIDSITEEETDETIKETVMEAQTEVEKEIDREQKKDIEK